MSEVVSTLDVIIGVIVAFLVSVCAVYLYYLISTHFKNKSNTTTAIYLEKFKYYETQLIDMKIRLDSMVNVPPSATAGSVEPIKSTQMSIPDEVHKSQVSLNRGTVPAATAPTPAAAPATSQPADNIPVPTSRHEPANQPANLIDHVLQLITTAPMTSRDIQVKLRKSREHTSRLMKKLYVDGYVQRNTESKPYTYSITEKGIAKINT